jgi:hypothetical protein
VKRSVALAIVEPPPAWEPLAGDPPPRGVCITGPRPCAYVECRNHLWTKAGVDRAGRPNNGRRPPTILRPLSQASCALDLVDRNPDGLSHREIAKLFGVTGERVRQIVRDARRKLIELRACR